MRNSTLKGWAMFYIVLAVGLVWTFFAPTDTVAVTGQLDTRIGGKVGYVNIGSGVLVQAVQASNVGASQDFSTTNTTMAETLAPGVQWELLEVRLHQDGTTTTVESFTVTIDSGQAAIHDTLLATQDMASLADFVFRPTRPIPLSATDELDFAFANSDANTWGLEVIYR